MSTHEYASVVQQRVFGALVPFEEIFAHFRRQDHELEMGGSLDDSELFVQVAAVQEVFEWYDVFEFVAVGFQMAV